jgi:hypothetical protein
MRGHFLRAVSKGAPTLAGTGGTIPQDSILGEPYDGGFFAGYISHTADGNPTHALIVAPAATGASGGGYTLTTNHQWKTANTTTAGTTSTFDGAANTAAMVTAGIANHPAAQFCVNLSIGGFTDWYMPAEHELDIAYFHLKPSTAENSTLGGINPYAVPARASNYTAGAPAQTLIAAFQAAPEAFATTIHWSSTEVNATNGLRYTFATGFAGATPKNSTNVRLRAFRRVTL